MPAYIVLYAPTKTRCDTGQETFLGGVVSDELGRVAAVDEVLELAAVEELVPAEEVEKDLVLLVAAHQELPEHLHLGQVHDAMLQQVLEEVHMPHLHLRLRWLPRHQVQRFVRLAHLVMFDVAADEVGERHRVMSVYPEVDVFGVEDGAQSNEKRWPDDRGLIGRDDRVLSDQCEIVGIVQRLIVGSPLHLLDLFLVLTRPVLGLVPFEILLDLGVVKGSIDDVVCEGLMGVEAVHELPERHLVAVFLVHVEDDRATDEGGHRF